MNRRNFLKNSTLALFGFSVLPPAETYTRIWKAQRDYWQLFACSPDFGMAVPVSDRYKLTHDIWKNGAELVACDKEYNVIRVVQRIGNPFGGPIAISPAFNPWNPLSDLTLSRFESNR